MTDLNNSAYQKILQDKNPVLIMFNFQEHIKTHYFCVIHIIGTIYI